MPVRKPKKNYRSLTGMFYSLKNQKGIFFESKLERDLFLTLEFNSNVISYEEQPMKLSYQKDMRTYPYTPDCLIHYTNDTPCIIEVKYSNEIKEKADFFKHKFNQIEKTLYEQGFSFQLFTEENIDSITLKNMNFIYNYVTIKDQNMVSLVHKEIIPIGSTTYNELLNKLSSNKYKKALYAPYIWYLVLLGKIQINLSEEINPQTYMEIVV